MTFLLDTNICVRALEQHARVLQHMLSQSRAEVAVSVITQAELRTGALESARPTKALRLVESLLRPLSILELSCDDAAAYAVVRAKLERAGAPMGPLDTLIAAQAVARRLVLVTDDARAFGRVAGLRVESWTR